MIVPLSKRPTGLRRLMAARQGVGQVGGNNRAPQRGPALEAPAWGSLLSVENESAYAFLTLL